ncbi:MAG: hypothetical protein P1P89_03790 [Desulfobacterales bacterium]|nr:hypothetical protein [Desulfobacterales bacterium]
MSYNEAETRYHLIDPVLRKKGYDDHQRLRLETPAPVESTGAKGRRCLDGGRRQLAISQEDLARARLDAFCERMQDAGVLNLPEVGRG